MNFKVTLNESFTLIEFECGILSPDDLKTIQPPSIDCSKGVVLSGRGPVWLFCFLSHYYHPTAWVGTYDPRVGGAIVSQTHSPKHTVGDIIKIEQNGV